MTTPQAADIIALYRGRAGLAGATFQEFSDALPPGSAPVEDEGVVVVAAPTALNFIGLGVTATDNGGVADITIPVVPIQDETVEIVANPSALNFAGAGVVVTDVAGVATVTIPENFLPIEDEGSSIVAAPSAMNFVGAGVTVTDVAGVATATIPGGGAGETIVQAFKQADTSRASTTTLTDDPDLVLTGLTTGRWAITLGIGRLLGNATAGIKFDFALTASLVIGAWNAWIVDLDAGGGSTHRGQDDPTTDVGYAKGSAIEGYINFEIVADITTGGTLTFRWSQNTSNAAATVVNQNSFFRARRLGDLT